MAHVQGSEKTKFLSFYIAVGEYRPEAHQPIWFSKPKMLCDTHGVGVGPGSLVWLAMYASLTERDGKRIFWYPDRKHFLPGRYITDEMLADLTVPTGGRYDSSRQTVN